VHKITLVPWASYLDYSDSSNSPDFLTVHKITHTPKAFYFDYLDSFNSPDYLTVHKITDVQYKITLIP
jgi:hypothetical protein